ncbi:magnesium/cobalt transporter CorA [bacterium]|nr:magnesium/cobalt transporter CorA [bacterium]
MAVRKPRNRQRKKTLHMAPGSIVIDSAMERPHLRAIVYDEKNLSELNDISPAQIPPLIPTPEVLWVHVDGFGDQALIEQLRDAFHLHRLAVEDVVSLHQRPKAEDYDRHLYIVIQIPYITEGQLRTEQLSLFLGDNWVLTFEERPPDNFDPVRDRLRTRKGIIRDNKADYLAYALIDCLLDCYFPVLESYCDRMEILEQQMLTGHGRKHVAEVHHVKQELLQIRRSLWPTREMLTLLLRNERNRFSPTALVHLRDCLDHANQLIDLVEVYRELAGDLVNLHLTNASIRQNEVMKVLTIVSAIFIPLSFIAGLYGMNFDPDASPWNMPELHWTFGYPAALGTMAVTALGLFLFIRSKGWLKDD